MMYQPKPGLGQNPEKITIDFSIIAILKVVVIVLILVFLYLIKEILAILFVAVILASVIDPVADWCEKRKIPRSLGVIFVYLVLLGFVSFTIVLLIPPLISQFKQLVNNFPSYWEQLGSSFIGFQEQTAQYGILNNLQKGLQAAEAYLTGGIFNTISGIFGGAVFFLLVLVIAFYMVVQEEAIKKAARSITPYKYIPYLTHLFLRMQKKLGLWVRAQFILMVIIGLLSYLGLRILGVNYALTLAILAGLGEFIPYLGPIITAVPAVFLAFTQSPLIALLVVALYLVIQQVENHLLVPKIMQKTVGLNPIVSIVALLIGAKVGGIIGAILAIPVATALSVFLQDFLREKEEV